MDVDLWQEIIEDAMQEMDDDTIFIMQLCAFLRVATQIMSDDDHPLIVQGV